MKKAPDYSAPSLLTEALECIENRASERDTQAERSMHAAVKAFNAMYGTSLSEEQGWSFMALLKLSRAKGGDFRRDDYVDAAAYMALAGEAAFCEREFPSLLDDVHPLVEASVPVSDPLIDYAEEQYLSLACGEAQ